MKKTLFLFLTALALSGKLCANPVDVQTAKQLGIRFMNANTEVKSAEAELTYTVVADSGQACFYVFSVHPKGFVIVSADDRMRPILGYSTESNFTAQLPDGLRTFFDNYKAGFEQMVANQEERTEAARADWTCLAETGRLNDTRITRSVAPLLNSIWNQTDLYNNMAPEDPTSVYSEHCKSGCVANAMSQVMRFWEWPRHGQGGHGYNADTQYGNYGWQEANFENATYHFELMPDFLDFASPQSEVDATALLEFHAGVSVDMMYGPNASGAYSEDVGPAMLEYFRYSPDLQYRGMDYNRTAWENDLRSNLDAGMPLYYSSSGPDGGHAYVLDGYDSNNLFHLNWGWAGFDNGWYAIDGFYLTFYYFPWYHRAVFNLHPNEDYYDAPKAVGNLETYAYDLETQLVFNPVYETRNGDPLTQIDSIIIMRDGVVITSLPNVTDTQVEYYDVLEKYGTYYYTVYAINEAGMSKVVRDTIMVGPNCDLRFELSDSGNDGWDMSSIAVLDEDGKVSQRVGLWDGGEASLMVPVPDDQTVTFFWTYDNTCYSHGSLAEVSYEIYDWDDNLIVASDGYPEVGVITDYEVNCSMDCSPVSNLEGTYQWNEEEFGVVLTWDWDGDDSSFKSFSVFRDDGDAPFQIAMIEDPTVNTFYDALNEIGEAKYGVSVSYERLNEWCESDFVWVAVAVTATDEQVSDRPMLYPNPASHSFAVEGEVKEIRVYDVLGQLIHQGREPLVDVTAWPEGVYFVRMVDESDLVSVVRLMKR